MHSSRRGFFLGGAAIAALCGAGLPAFAAGGGGFTVSGKRGPYLKQVAGNKFAVGQGSGDGMGLASDALNQGRFQAAKLRMPQTEAKLADLVAKLDANWPYAKAEPPKVFVIGLNFYNAYSLPDNSIVVGFGLLDHAQSDDEVAFVLAHELGHLRLGHFAHGASFHEPSMTSQLGQLYVVGSALQSGAASLRGGGNGVDAFNSTAATKAGATNDFIHYLNTSMVEPSHSQEQEDQADAIGYDLCTGAGFTADAATARVFDTVQADTRERQQETQELQGQLDTDLSKVVNQGTIQSLASGGSIRSVADGLMPMAGQLMQGMSRGKQGQQDSAPKHRPPEERKKGIAQYSVDAYPQGAPLRDEQTAWLSSVRGSDEYVQAKAAVGAVYDAMKARAAGDYAGASASIQRAQATGFGQSPLVLNEAARLRDDMNDPTVADQLFRQAHANPDQSVDGYVDHVRMLYRRDQLDPARQIIKAGVSRFDEDDKPFLSLQIAIARQAGRSDEVQRRLAHCVDYDDPALTRDCKLAAGVDPDARDQDSAPHIDNAPSLPFTIPGLPHP